MKTPLVLLIAAACCLLAACCGMLPTDTTAQAIDTANVADTPQLVPSDTIGRLAELDTSVIPEAPTLAEPENPSAESAAKSCPSCPASTSSTASRSSNSRARSARGENRDFILFDGDGHLIDRRADAAAARGDAREGRWFPGKFVLRTGWGTVKVATGVNRRQHRRANGGGVFRCRCS